MFGSSLYVRSPKRAQEALIAAWALARKLMREGKPYREALSRARDRETWTADQLLAYQQEKVERLLAVAKTIPYYAPLVERDILSMPYLTKQRVREESLIAETAGKRFYGHTSGTTGTPLKIAQDLPAIIRENAFIGRQLAWSGYKQGEPRAWIRGDMVVPVNSGGPYWRLNRADNMLMMSSYHLSPSTAEAYISALARQAPTMIQAYPSSICFLARYLQATNQFYRSSLKCIVTSSEAIAVEDRALVEGRFRCKVFDWYGQFERVAAIGSCPKGNYHLLTDYSFAELDPTDDGCYEIVGTGFNNFLMPLIRYRTGDFVAFSGRECSCGMAFPVIDRIYGRDDNYVKMSDGRLVGRLDHIFKGLTGIAEAQIIQERVNEIRVVVVPLDGFTSRTEVALIDNARQRLGPTASVVVETVSQLARTKNGKHRAVVCRA